MQAKKAARQYRPQFIQRSIKTYLRTHESTLCKPTRVSPHKAVSLQPDILIFKDKTKQFSRLKK